MTIFEQLIRSGELAFDVGSNVGEMSDKLLKLGARVVAFEPQRECFISASNRFRGNQNYVAENVALDDKKSEAVIYIATYSGVSSMSSNFIAETKKNRFFNVNWNNSSVVQTDTLDNMCAKYGDPTFIKIDVEGYELNVLKGLTHPVKVISVEFTPELCDATVSCINYIDTLNGGQTEFNYGYRSDDYLKYRTWISKEEIIAYLRSVDDYQFEYGDVYCRLIAT